MDDISVLVGKNIRKMRDEKGLSLGNLSEMTGVSKSMLGQIERGESSPSINVLWKISIGLKVDINDLVSAVQQDVEVVGTPRPKLLDDGKVKMYRMFKFGKERNFSIYRIEIESQGYYESVQHVKGAQEYITVYYGTLTLEIEDKVYSISKGESIRFDAHLKHRYINDTLIGLEFESFLVYK